MQLYFYYFVNKDSNEETDEKLNVTKKAPPSFLEIRGEVYIKQSDFKTLNNNRITENKNLFKDLRNATSGYLREYKENHFVKKILYYYAYKAENIKVNTQIENLKNLENWGFKVCNKHIISSKIKKNGNIRG